MENIDLDEISIKQKIKEEVSRMKQFNQTLLDTKEEIKVQDIDIRNYAKYILKSGKDLEKRELLGCLKSRLHLISKQVTLVQS
jgi:hypothetical protein